MKSHSSIFSFESLELTGLRPRGLVLALALLLAFELTVPRIDHLWSWSPRSQVGVFEYIEEELLEREGLSPSIVVLGSSRIRDAVAPALLEKELGLPPGSVINLGITAGTPFDALSFYERNREVLSRARLVVVGVEDWYANGSIPPTNRVRRYATLADRTGVYARGEQRKLVMGRFWRTFDARRVIVEYFTRTAPGWLEPPGLLEDGRLRWRTEEAWVGPELVDIETQVSRNYESFEPHYGRFALIERLAEVARETGAFTVVTDLPWRDSYAEAVLSDHAEEFDVYRDYLARAKSAVGDETGSFPTRGSEMGIAPTCFYDYGHMTGCGADVFTRALADRLRPLVTDAPDGARGELHEPQSR